MEECRPGLFRNAPVLGRLDDPMTVQRQEFF